LFSEGNGYWCAQVDVSVVGCNNMTEPSSKYLQIGTEISASVEPYNVTRDESNWEANGKGGTGYAWQHEVISGHANLCIQRNPYDPALGDIRSWTC
jgi:hypothetical protein